MYDEDVGQHNQRQPDEDRRFVGNDFPKPGAIQ